MTYLSHKALKARLCAATQMMHSLTRFNKAFSYVRGAVPDPELIARLDKYQAAIVLIQNKLSDLIDPSHDIYEPCELNNLITKAVSSDEELRNALRLTGLSGRPTRQQLKPGRQRAED